MKRYKRLGESDRITINVLSKKGFSDADIARDIGVHRATVGREKRRTAPCGPWPLAAKTGSSPVRTAAASALRSFTRCNVSCGVDGRHLLLVRDGRAIVKQFDPPLARGFKDAEFEFAGTLSHVIIERSAET
jgi:hypothetical protein